MLKNILIILAMSVAGLAFAQPYIAPNAPQDNVVTSNQRQYAAMDKAIAPYVATARKTYPAAKQRFLAVLPPKQSFFVTTRLKDKQGKIEQVFIAVERIEKGKISGRIWSQIAVVSGFHHGDRYTFAEAQLLDWLITKPDGTEEGNFVGKFLDTYQP